MLNAPMHCFGIHHDCDPYFCTKETKPEAEDIVAMLKDDGVFSEILSLCTHYFASSVPSMLLNYNNNMAESFNNLVAKYTGTNVIVCLNVLTENLLFFNVRWKAYKLLSG